MNDQSWTLKGSSGKCFLRPSADVEFVMSWSCDLDDGQTEEHYELYSYSKQNTFFQFWSH